MTQQLVKNSVIGDERNLERKIPEAAIAIRLERQLSKDEILEAYLNTVYFGSGAYGVRAAAEIYFGTTPDRLTWPQSALLASLIGMVAHQHQFIFTQHQIGLTRLHRGLIADGQINDARAKPAFNIGLCRRPSRYRHIGVAAVDIIKEVMP
ncbi:MAG: biosynthetic peptidoglycan transglycosylase [Alphaproteobacteria bacterium]